MALKSWLASLKGDVTDVTHVQAPIHAGLRCNGIEATDVTGVTDSGGGAAVVTSVTAAESQTLQPEPAWTLGCTLVTAVTAEKVNTETHAANDAAADPDRWCWPHSPAWNSGEVDTFTERVSRFTAKGVTLTQAQAAADRLVSRDRESDDRALCLECTHLQGYGPWRCGNWQRADMAREGIAPALMVMLQRCTGFKGFNYMHRTER